MSEDDKMNNRRQSVDKALRGYNIPDFKVLADKSNPDWNKEYMNALTYSNIVFEVSELKQFTEKYFTQYNISNVPDWEFMNIGKRVWIKTRGGLLHDDYEDKLPIIISELVTKYSNDKETIRLDIKSRKTSNVLAELEGLLDDVVLNRNNLPQPLSILQNNIGFNVELVYKHFSELLAEVSDEELKEYFKDKNKLIVVLGVILKDIEKFTSNKSLSRKPRQTKAKKINPTKAVRKLKYLKDFKELNLVSIEPEKIISSNILWVYNTKTRKLGKYVAKTDKGLMIKGSTILDYDEKESVSKKLRKPQETISKLLTSGKVEQRKIINEIKAISSPLTGRINTLTVLLKTF